MFLIKILLMVPLVESKFDWKFLIKRGGKEPARPFQYNQLLAMAQRKKQLYAYGTIVQKVQNRKIRNLLANLTDKDGAKNNSKKNQKKFRINRLKSFQKNWTKIFNFCWYEILIVCVASFYACFRVLFLSISVSCSSKLKMNKIYLRMDNLTPICGFRLT